MDMNEFHKTSAKLNRLMALKALKESRPNDAHKHLRASRREANAATLYEPNKVTDIRSAKKKDKKGK